MTGTEKNEELLSSVFADIDSNLSASEACCTRFTQHYKQLTSDSRGPFLYTLAEKFGFDKTHVLSQAKDAGKDDSDAALLRKADKLRLSLQPRYRTLFTQIARQDGGVQFLVSLRADVLGLTRQRTNTELQSALYQELNVCLKDLLALWFTPGFLDVQRVTWDSPCHLVQRISELEAVHSVASWQDIQRRVGTSRRCYVFTHKSLPGIPVVMLHVGLASEISACIHSLIDKPSLCDKNEAAAAETKSSSKAGEKAEQEDTSKIHAAVFYSITSTQKGLQGIEMGKLLIKAAVSKLLEEFPNMTQFSSLSPVPGFRDWLLAAVKQKSDAVKDPVPSLVKPSELSALATFQQSGQATSLDTFVDLISTHDWCRSDKLQQVMKPILLRLCAHYLYKEKRRNFALNPVANFHLSNGAELWRINFLADTSKQGMDQACSLMVNYRYFLDAKDGNASRYQDQQHIAVSQSVRELLQ